MKPPYDAQLPRVRCYARDLERWKREAGARRVSLSQMTRLGLNMVALNEVTRPRNDAEKGRLAMRGDLFYYEDAEKGRGG